jgi:hypothetical protein
MQSYLVTFHDVLLGESRQVEAKNVENRNERVVAHEVKLQIVIDWNHYRHVHRKCESLTLVDNCLSCSPLSFKPQTVSDIPAFQGRQSRNCPAKARHIKQQV